MQEKTNCKKCKQTGPSIKQIGMITLGFYLLISSGYGTYIFIKNIISFFN
jgi:hypothetical protein